MTLDEIAREMASVLKGQKCGLCGGTGKLRDGDGVTMCGICLGWGQPDEVRKVLEKWKDYEKDVTI